MIPKTNRLPGSSWSSWPDFGEAGFITGQGLDAPASICALIFIDGEAGELGDIAHFLQALARMEHHFWFAVR